MVGKSVRQAPIYDEIEDLGGKKHEKRLCAVNPWDFIVLFVGIFKQFSIVNVQAAQN